jgi:N-acetylneuraminic acid mutarotase
MRSLVVLGAIVLVAAAATVCLVKYVGGSGRATKGATSARSSSTVSSQRGARLSSRTARSTPIFTAALASSQLAAPVDGEVVLSAPSTQLVVMGGATTGGSLASGVFVFDTSTGKLVHLGNLTMALDDASGAVIAGQDVVFGGSSPTALSTVQGLLEPGALATTGGGSSNTGALTTATVLGALPQARADAGVATIGTTTYLVGGDNGTSTVPQVVATNDGRTFVTVASLAQPVRFGAVAALGTKLYVFGGQSMSQSGPSSFVDTIQMVDPATHRARIVGHLPEPLSEASAVTVGGQVLVIGGITVENGPGSARSVATGSATGSAGGYSTATVPSIWTFDEATAKVSRVAQLPEPVALAGVAVEGSVTWVVGGESSGVPVSSVQVIQARTVSRH